MILGIDPGKSGAIAALDGDDLSIHLLRDTEADAWNFLVLAAADFAILEQVHSMPKQGLSSTFKFGTSYGFCRGILVAAGVPFETVTPGKWQRAMGCLSKGNKNITKAKAQELFPQAKYGVRITHGNADAILLAEYGRRCRTQPAPAFLALSSG